MNDITKKMEQIINSIVNCYKTDKMEIVCSNKKNENTNEKNIQIIINQITNTYRNNKYNSSEINKKNQTDTNLLNVIGNIKKSFIDDFERFELHQIEKLHRKIINGISIPVLYVCGKGTHEIRYTKYLAYFINDKNNHGLNNQLFVTLFGEYIKSVVSEIDYNVDFEVIDEYYLPLNIFGKEIINNSIDIAILSTKFNIFIEQKIHSGESNNPKTDLGQLVRYGNAIDTAFPSKKNIKIYLTPTGQIPDDVNDWIGISHLELVKKAIQLFSTDLSSVAKANLSSLLMDLSIGPYFDFDIISKIRELTEKIIIDKSIFRFTELKLLLTKNELLSTLLNQ
jgi:hypothetical protein